MDAEPIWPQRDVFQWSGPQPRAAVIHVLAPGGRIDGVIQTWRKLSGRYLFNAFALAKAFRGKFLAEAAGIGQAIVGNVPKKRIVHCDHMGPGAPALKYLARYLYRGVISGGKMTSPTKMAR